MAVSGASLKRRESVSNWFKQLLIGQEQQGTAKAAASAWLGTIYGLRAASRMDANREWGKAGDDMIGCLEQAYIDNMGKEAAQAIEMGRKLLRTDEKPEMPKPVVVPKVRQVRPVMPKLPHMKDLPKIKVKHPDMKASTSGKGKAKAKAKAKVGKGGAAKGGKKAKARR